MFEHLPLLCSLCPHFFHRVCHFQPLHYLAFFYYSCQHTLSEGQKALSGWRGAMSRFLNVLRSWLMMTSIIVVGHSLQSFRDHTFLYENIYTGKPDLGISILGMLVGLRHLEAEPGSRQKKRN
ncbi:ergosterol biosynthetic protein 28 homolog isoform X5 [Bubalus bubalis]|uniref:ergosterol biosynthetic protein 28 homolog isoform X5 n=1 Tax=Bubalus bubalis TaxID=89462 RepID=UPI001E1B6DD8|nr:ergosterol biosynthetic protein 28 homolog isoform X5 [Bubalus bubalis]